MMTAKQMVSLAADLVAVVLMIYQMARLSKAPGEKGSLKRYFRLFSGLVLLMSVLHLLRTYADIQMGGITPEDFGNLAEGEVETWYLMEVISGITDIFLSTVFLNMWITFLSWYLYEDRDFIRRKFWVGFAPLIISSVVACVSIPMALMSKQGFLFFIAAVCVFSAACLFYFLIALKLLREYKKQNGYLRFFNPWAYFVPVFAGWLIQDGTDWGVGALGTTIGVVLLYSSITEEEEYLDEGTGFYNRDFITYLKNLVGRKKYSPCSAMTFAVSDHGEMKSFSGLLKKQLPKDCEPILRNACEVVVLTNVRERGPLVMVIEDVRAVSDVKAGCVLKKKSETTEEFMERVL